nr:hypothetical protein CFP56_21478 [Quercus suber]
MAQRRRGRRGGIGGNQMDVGEGVEANPLVGSNVGRNQNIEKEDVIAELRKQVAALTEVVQRMQPPHETTDASDDSHSHFENPFGAPPRGLGREFLAIISLGIQAQMGEEKLLGLNSSQQCGELGHRSSDSRKKALMLEEVKEPKHEDGEPIFDQPSNEVVVSFHLPAELGKVRV